jgi:hypothetical protein
MMRWLHWDKPRRAKSHEEWSSLSADGAPPGVYTPNMSQEDKLKWKAKHFGGKLPRVEIRKTAGSQVKIVVSLKGRPWHRRKLWRDGEYKKVDCGHDDNVVISMNGPAHFTFDEIDQLQSAIYEARQVLLLKEEEARRKEEAKS